MEKLPLIISLSLVAFFVVSYFIFPSFHNFINESFEVLTSNDQELIKGWVSQFRMAGPVALILIMVVQMFMFIIPNILIMVVAIISYGPIWGSVISFLGVFVSSSVGYMIGRFLSPITVNRLMNSATQQRIRVFIEQYGVAAIAITRISSLSNDSLSIVAGLLKMTYQKYIIATLSGITPLIVLLAIYGKNGKILNALIWVAVISLVLLVIYIIIDKKRRKRRDEF
jgi:uncharacterized membrane protein YdjX (TVP38/TMEM64 family)